MGISANLSDLLHKDSLDLGSAASLIQPIIDNSLYTDDSWNPLWEALAFPRHHEIEIVTPRRWQRQPTLAMNDYETTGSSTTSNSASSDN